MLHQISGVPPPATPLNPLMDEQKVNWGRVLMILAWVNLTQEIMLSGLPQKFSTNHPPCIALAGWSGWAASAGTGTGGWGTWAGECQVCVATRCRCSYTSWQRWHRCKQWFPCMQFLMYQSCSQFSPPELLVSSINSQIVVDCHFIPRNEETAKAVVEDWGQVGFLFTHLK